MEKGIFGKFNQCDVVQKKYHYEPGSIPKTYTVVTYSDNGMVRIVGNGNSNADDFETVHEDELEFVSLKFPSIFRALSEGSVIKVPIFGESEKPVNVVYDREHGFLLLDYFGEGRSVSLEIGLNQFVSICEKISDEEFTIILANAALNAVIKGK